MALAKNKIRDIKLILIGIFTMAMVFLLMPINSNLININYTNKDSNNLNTLTASDCREPNNIENNIKTDSAINIQKESIFKIGMPNKIILKKYPDPNDSNTNGLISFDTQGEVIDNKSEIEIINIEQENAGLDKAEKEITMLKTAKKLRAGEVTNEKYQSARNDFNTAAKNLKEIQNKIKAIKQDSENNIYNDKIKIELSKDIANRLLRNKTIKKTISFIDEPSKEYEIKNNNLELSLINGNYVGYIYLDKTKGFYKNNKHNKVNITFYFINNLLDRNKYTYKIPSSAVFKKDGMNYIWKLNTISNTINQYKLKEFSVKNNMIEISHSVNTGEIIIGDNINGLQENQEININ